MQPKRIPASSWQPPGDALVLAAVDRAERHHVRHIAHLEDPDPGVPISEIAAHLALDWNAHTSRRLRPLLARLTDELGWLEHHRGRWMLTPAGSERVAVALADGVAAELPESPQHRHWRTARAHAAGRIDALRADLDAKLGALGALLRNETPPPSDDWLALADTTREAIRRVAFATYCLHEWAQPDDAHADVDHPTLAQTGRRNPWYWDGADVR